MTTITPISGNITATDNRSASDVVYLVSAVYATANSTALNVTAGSNIEIVFRNGGSVFNTFESGAALSSTSDIRLTVEEGSTLSSGIIAVSLQGDVLNLSNFGLIVGQNGGGINGAGNGSTVANYGEVRGATAYSAMTTAGSTINNFGAFRANTSAGNALDLGNPDDRINNYGTIFGTTKLYAGNDSIFNSGTMRGDAAIVASSGDKTITNTGFIGTTVLGNDAITTGGGVDLIFNFGEIYGTIHLGSGADAYQSYDGATMSAGVLGEAGDDNLIGNGFDDSLSGGDGNDTLIGNGGDDGLVGGAGDDDMHGGAGNDSYIVDSQGDTITDSIGRGTDAVNASASYTLGAGAEIEFLINNTGVGLTLTGNEFAQTIYGHLAASDTLAGGGGADTLNGQGGSDTYNLGAFDASIVDSGGTADLVTSTITRSLAPFAGIERLTLLASSSINGSGNGLANTITGNTGNNVLDGGGGADALIGLAGNDTYVLGNANDTVTDTAGIDTITSTVTRSLAAFASIENLTLLGVGNGTGNGLANIVTGSAAANILDGGLGNDTLRGLTGNDALIGGLGKDISTGGAGNDTFRFALKTHSPVGINADIVTDFDDVGNDRIDVSALFGPAMTYRHNLAFTAAGQVRINDVAGADVIVEVNTGGSLAADVAVRLANTTLASMSVGDFVL